jgi:acetyl-CoA acetyltransferase
MSPAIVGYGETELGEVPEWYYEEMNMWAVKEALNDAHMDPADVDGLIASPPFGSSKVGVYPIAEHLGLMPLRWGETTALGGASHLNSCRSAIRAIEAGLAETVVIVSADPFLSRMGRSDAVGSLSNAAGPYEEPANIIPSLYAHAATWHMDTFGTTEEELAKVAEIAYKHASMQREERTHVTEAKTVDEILDSQMVASPFPQDQCSLVSAGGAAIVITAYDNVDEDHHKPIELTGFGACHTHRHITQMPDFGSSGVAEAGPVAMDEAGVTRDDIDVMQIYDAFTYSVVRSLVDLGFCDDEEVGEYVMSGELEIGGDLPMNTHGGALAQVHPGLPSGIFHVTEAIRQLRGEAEATQVDDVDTALVTGSGGLYSTHCVSVLERGYEQ